MGKVAIQRPDNVAENLALTRNKLPTVGISSKAAAGQVRVVLTADFKVQSIQIDEAFKQAESAQEIGKAIQKALNEALEGVIDIRKAEINGRLNNNQNIKDLVDIIHTLV